MAHTKTQTSADSVKTAITSGNVSLNVQVNGFNGNPNPTLLALLSTGAISLSAPAAGLSLNGFGGE